MFVKVVRKDNDSVFECDRVHRRPVIDTPGFVEFSLEGHKPGSNISIQVQVEDRETSVYLMNDDGTTIERYGYRA